MKTKAVILIPTYNEQDSIAQTIHALENVFISIQKHEMSILIFDSASTDQTQNIIKQLQKKYLNIYFACEPKKSGLGSAYAQAIQYAIKELKADVVVEFDADGSHQPKYIPAMLDLLQNKADVVVGSRYVKGGSIPKDWGFHRKLLSCGGNIIARLFLTWKYKDFTSGFRATKTSYLKKINLDKLLSKGYAYKIHLFWLLHKLNAVIAEYPIEFIDREKGYSKLPRNNVMDSLRVVITLRFLELKRYIKVGMVGAVGAAVQFSIFNLLRLKFPPAAANLIGVECAIISGFILNNHFSFKDRKFQKHHGLKFWLKKFFHFNSVSLLSLIIQTGIVWLGTHFLGRGFWIENSLVCVGIFLASIINYKFYSQF